MLSNATTELTLELDEIQTWFFDMTIQPGLVLREHSVNDTLYENLMPEPFNITDYTYRLQTSVSSLISGIGMVGSKTWDGAQPVGTAIDGVFTNCYSGHWLTSQLSYSGIAEAINAYVATNGVESIVSIYPYYSPSISSYTLNNLSLDGYVPKNNKLKTYPYSFGRVISLDGNSRDFKFEESDEENQLIFTLQTVSFPDVAMRLVCKNYNGLDGANNQIIYTAFPVPAINTPAYLNFWATNKFSWGFSLLKDSITIGTGVTAIAAGDPTGMDYLSSGALSLAEKAANIGDLMNAPPNVASSGAGLSFVTKYLDPVFNIYQCTLRYDAAKAVDDYFTRFGYATNTIKQPNISSRPAFNYVKTSNIHVSGSAPADTRRVFEEALDRGMTFWKSTAKFGDYSQNNGV